MLCVRDHTCVCYGFYVYRDLFICVSWLLPGCWYWWYPYVYRDSYVYLDSNGLQWLLASRWCLWGAMHMCVVTHSYVYHDSLLDADVCEGSHICVSWLAGVPRLVVRWWCLWDTVHMFVVTHSYVYHDSLPDDDMREGSHICGSWLICVPWLLSSRWCLWGTICICVGTQSYMYHDSLLDDDIWEKSHTCVCHDSYVYPDLFLDDDVCGTPFIRALWLIHMCAMTLS